MFYSGVKTEAVRLVSLNYCIDQYYLESLLSLYFITKMSSFDELENADLLNFMYTHTAPFKTNFKIKALDRATKTDLRKDMRDNDAICRMQNLFISYHGALAQAWSQLVDLENPQGRRSEWQIVYQSQNDRNKAAVRLFIQLQAFEEGS